MMLRKISLIFAKYVAIFLCIIALLLSTPWGSRLTLTLFNNIHGITVDYHSGSLIQGIQLNTIHLKTSSLDITLKEFTTQIDLSCLFRNTLCIKSTNADSLFLRYLNNNKKNEFESIQEPVTSDKANTQLFEMPFSIDADLITINKSQLVINNTEIAIEQFMTQLSVNKSEFNLVRPTTKQVRLKIIQDEKEATSQSLLDSLSKTIAQLPDINLPIALNIEHLQLDDLVIATKPNANCQNNCSWQLSNNTLSGTWRHSEVKIREFETSTPEYTISKLTAIAKLTMPYQINSHIISQANEVKSWPEISNSIQHITLQGSLKNLSFDVSSKGNLALTSQGVVNLVHKDIPFTISMDTDKILVPSFISPAGVYSSLSLTSFGGLKKQTVELTSEFSGYGYNNAQLEIKASHQKEHFSIEQFIFNDPESASQLNVQGEIAILPADYAWQLSATSSGFTLPQLSLHNVAELLRQQEQLKVLTSNLPSYVSGRLQGKIQSTGAWSNNKWEVSLNDTHITGDLNKLGLNIESNISLDNSGHLQAGNLLINFNNSELTLQTASNDNWDIKGKLTVANINDWYEGVNGGFISDFSVSGESNNPVINVNNQFSHLNWQDTYSKFLMIEAKYHPMSNHQIQLTLKNDQLEWIRKNKKFNVDNFIFNVEGNADNHRIKTDWSGKSTGNLAVTGHFNNDFTHWHSLVELSHFTYLNTSIKNNKAFAVNVDIVKQESIIAPHCWQGNALNICLPTQTVIGKSGELLLTLNSNFAEVDELFLSKGVELNSRLHGDVNLKWSTQLPMQAKGHFTLSSGYLKVVDDFSEHQLSQWSNGEFSFAVNEQQLTNKLLLTGTDNQPLINIMSAVDLHNDYPIKAKVTLNHLNLHPFKGIIPEVVNLQGKLTADLSIDGTLNTPTLNGGLTLEQGQLTLRDNANTFDNIAAEIAIENNQMTLGGKFSIEESEANLYGTMSWKDDLTMNVDLTANALPLLFPPQLVISVSPKLNFSLIDKSLTISGNIDVLTGHYNIEKLPDSSVSLSDDVIILGESDQVLDKRTSSFDIKKNINVHIDEAFKVDGQGLDTHLFGELKISQKEKHPFQLFGQIQSTKGTFQAYGQKLQIDTGEFTFNGPIDNPYFNLRASRQIKAEDINVGIQITGLTNALDMQLFSSPTMERSEMLSYLVRGRGIDTGTEHSTAAASLLVGFGVTNSLGIFDEIEKIPLINNISIDTEGVGEQTQATVSGYVGNRVYLKYGIGVYEPINELTVRMFLFNRLWLEIVSGIEHSTDLYYSFEID